MKHILPVVNHGLMKHLPVINHGSRKHLLPVVNHGRRKHILPAFNYGLGNHIIFGLIMEQEQEHSFLFLVHG